MAPTRMTICGIVLILLILLSHSMNVFTFSGVTIHKQDSLYFGNGFWEIKEIIKSIARIMIVAHIIRCQSVCSCQ